MSKGFRRFVIMLTAISVMLTMTVSPVMGEQYSDTLNVSVRYNEDAMWEGTEAEIITEAVDESDEAEAESPTPEACDNEKPIQEAGSEEQPEPGDRVWEPICEGWVEEQQSDADVPDKDEQGLPRAYAQDEERFARYYEGLKEFDVPSPDEGEQEEDEELVGANTPSSYITSRLTPVRDQGTSGLCWAFSAAALMETSLLQRYTDENKNALDLSEEQLAYFYFNRQDDPLHNTGDMQMVYQDSDEATAYRHASGSPIYLLQELSTGQGIAKEADVPFYLTRRVDSKGNVYYKESSAVPSKNKAYISYAGLESYETFDYSVDKVKKEIMENGAVAVSMYYENASRNLTTNGYYDSANMRSNHVVTLVGWDDAFAVSKFNSGGRPKKSGAWIAKNSWGDDWGDGGYFYISYENATMLGCVSVSAVKTAERKYSNLYFYDGLAMVGNSCCLDPVSAVSGENMTAGANVYEVKAGAGRGEAIGEISLCTWTGNARYKVTVFTDLLDTDDPTSGRRAVSQTVQMNGAGLNTFRLPKEVVVSSGSWYSIVVENIGNRTESFSAQRRQLVGDVLFETDNLYCRSLVRMPCGKWMDLAEEGDGEVLRIRAATRTLGTAKAGRKVFSDVLDPSHPYYNAIYWAADKGIAGGYSDGTFGIDRACTRAEAIRFLWCFAGKPEPKQTPALSFRDVPKSGAFYKPILWAYQTGIAGGYSDGTFRMNEACTRGHIMMFIWKYLRKPVPAMSSASPFCDVPKQHIYYRAILYGYQKKITKGFADGTFGVDKNCTRGQIVKFLHNLSKQ
ncbi:MAG: S-layer homology domain-containing protein [Lachnospiraceae bacterium]|nr:S-layer homology domain-containing protein [Lachnospiraceae bacterium]